MVNITSVSTSEAARLRQHFRVAETFSSPVELQPLGTPVSSFVHISDPNSPSMAGQFEEVYYISGELPGGYWLYYALPVRVSLDDREFIAEQPHLELHAFGGSSAEAIMNLREQIAEQYARLSELGSKVSPRLESQRELLEFLLTARNG